MEYGREIRKVLPTIPNAALNPCTQVAGTPVGNARINQVGELKDCSAGTTQIRKSDSFETSKRRNEKI